VRLDVDPADGTPLVLPEPLVDTLDVEEVHAGQPPHVLVRLELGEADRALVRLLLLLLGLASSSGGGLPLRELVRERVPLDARPSCSPRHTGSCSTSFCVQSHVFLKANHAAMVVRE